MSDTEFDIVFRGDIVIGQRLDEVKQRLQQLFKADATKVDALFSGRPTPLKRNLDHATATKYRDVLLKAGVQVDICASGSVSYNQVAVEPVRRAVWSLAPVGAYLLTPTERPKLSPIIIDTSRMSLRAAEGNILDAAEAAQAPVASVAVPDLVLAAVGENLVSPDERPALPLMEVEFGDWDLADVGADLISAEERPVIASPAIAVGDYGLAPVGADLGQLKPIVEPLAPDISGLSLED
jgi:hypothetical protein